MNKPLPSSKLDAIYGRLLSRLDAVDRRLAHALRTVGLDQEEFLTARPALDRLESALGQRTRDDLLSSLQTQSVRWDELIRPDPEDLQRASNIRLLRI